MIVNILTTLLIVLQQYWGIFAVGICGGLYLGLNKYAQSAAKTKAKEFILKAEYEAEQFALQTGKEKFDWVVETAYPMLPVMVRKFVSEDAFRSIVQYVFDVVIDWAEENSKQNPAQ